MYRFAKATIYLGFAFPLTIFDIFTLIIDYVGTVNGPTSITQLGSFENVAKIASFSF